MVLRQTTRQSPWGLAALRPKAPREYIYLADAFEVVGRKLFGSDWLGTEAAEPVWPVRDKYQKLQGALKLMEQPVPPTSLASPRFRASAHSTPEQIEAQKAALERLATDIEAEAERNTEIVRRRLVVAEWIAERARNGEIGSFGTWVVRPSPPTKLPPHIWNGVHDWEVFSFCQATVLAGTGTATYNVFLSRADLETQMVSGTARRATTSLEAQDAQLLQEMRELIEGKKASGAQQASMAVMERAAGHGTLESRAKRLERGYRKWANEGYPPR